MIFLINFGRELKTTWQRIIRNPSHAFAAIFVMTITFLVGAAFSVILLGSHILLNYFESKPQVTAFLKDDATQTQIKEVEDSLQSTGKVAKFKFVSKEEALGIFKQQNEKEPVLLEFVSSSILPASLEVSASDVTYLPELADSLSNEKIVEEVIFQRDIVAKLTQITNSIRNAGIVITGALLGSSLFILLIILGFSISSFKDEIEIMRLVGASSSYIRNPFIFEAIFYGLVSSLLATGFSYLLFYYLSPMISPLFLGIPLFPVPNSLYFYILGVEAALGILIGSVIATVATWKHLRV